jgi:hypothetical protein
MEGNLSAVVVEFFEALEAVASIARHLAGLVQVADCLASSRQSHLSLDDFLFLH